MTDYAQACKVTASPVSKTERCPCCGWRLTVNRTQYSSFSRGKYSTKLNYRISCDRCGFMSRGFDSREEVVVWWNGRTIYTFDD